MNDHVPVRFYVLYISLLAISLLYPLGNQLKDMTEVPEFIRFHLGDVGFPVAQMVGMVIVVMIVFRKDFNDYDGILRLAVISLAIGLVLSYAYECFTGYMHASDSTMAQSPIGNFDWIDIVAYTLGATIGFVVLWRMKRILEKSSPLVNEGSE